VDYREQIVLQSAQNAMPEGASIATYRFRHVADRLTQRGLLHRIETTAQQANYTITAAGLGALRARSVLRLRADPADVETQLAAE
jgi:hypothetical protein